MAIPIYFLRSSKNLYWIAAIVNYLYLAAFQHESTTMPFHLVLRLKLNVSALADSNDVRFIDNPYLPTLFIVFLSTVIPSKK